MMHFVFEKKNALFDFAHFLMYTLGCTHMMLLF